MNNKKTIKTTIVVFRGEVPEDVFIKILGHPGVQIVVGKSKEFPLSIPPEVKKDEKFYFHPRTSRHFGRNMLAKMVREGTTLFKDQYTMAIRISQSLVHLFRYNLYASLSLKEFETALKRSNKRMADRFVSDILKRRDSEVKFILEPINLDWSAAQILMNWDGSAPIDPLLLIPEGEGIFSFQNLRAEEFLDLFNKGIFHTFVSPNMILHIEGDNVHVHMYGLIGTFVSFDRPAFEKELRKKTLEDLYSRIFQLLQEDNYSILVRREMTREQALFEMGIVKEKGNDSDKK